MTDKIVIPISDQLNRKDLEIILEVNRKSIEIETEVADQNEEIIKLLNDNKDNQEALDEKLDKIVNDKLDKIIKLNEEMNKDLFKIQVLFLTGLLSLVVQVIQIFVKK